MISIGIDTHKMSLAVSAVDELGRPLAARSVKNNPAGHAALSRWIRGLGPDRRIGIEGSGSYGAALAQVLVAAGETVVEVPAHLTAAERKAGRPRGKSDPGDAVAIARITAREPKLPAIGQPGIWADLHVLVSARDGLMEERTRLINRLHAHLLVLAPGYGQTIPNLTAARHRRVASQLLAGLTGARADVARLDLERLTVLEREIGALGRRIEVLVKASGSRLTNHSGVGILTAAKMLGETGDVRRFRAAGSFALASGTAPIPASSGQTQRHRLNRGGNRQLNRALHTMAMAQARHDPRAQAYLARRTRENKSEREAVRALKRLLANVVYRQMLADSNGPALLT